MAKEHFHGAILIAHKPKGDPHDIAEQVASIQKFEKERLDLHIHDFTMFPLDDENNYYRLSVGGDAHMASPLMEILNRLVSIRGVQSVVMVDVSPNFSVKMVHPWFHSDKKLAAVMVRAHLASLVIAAQTVQMKLDVLLGKQDIQPVGLDAAIFRPTPAPQRAQRVDDIHSGARHGE